MYEMKSLYIKRRRQDEGTNLSVTVSFKFFPLGVVGASFFMVEEEKTPLLVTLHSNQWLYCKL